MTKNDRRLRKMRPDHFKNILIMLSCSKKKCALSGMGGSVFKSENRHLKTAENRQNRPAVTAENPKTKYDHPTLHMRVET